MKFNLQSKINNLLSTVFKADVSTEATEVETFDALEKAVAQMAENASTAEDLQKDLNTANSNFETLNSQFTEMKNSFKTLNDSFQLLDKKVTDNNFDSLLEEKLTVLRTQFVKEIAEIKSGVTVSETSKTIEGENTKSKQKVEMPGSDWNAKKVTVSTIK